MPSNKKIHSVTVVSEEWLQANGLTEGDDSNKNGGVNKPPCGYLDRASF